MSFGWGCVGRGFSLHASVKYFLGMPIKELASNPGMDLPSFNHSSWPHNCAVAEHGMHRCLGDLLLRVTAGQIH